MIDYALVSPDDARFLETDCPGGDAAAPSGDAPSGDAPVTVALGRFQALLGRDLTEVLREDRAVRVLASDLDGAGLERVAAQLAPQVAILDEADGLELAVLGRLRDAHPTIGVIVLASRPTVAYGTRLFAGGASCVSKDVSAADVLDAVRIAATGRRVFVDVEGHLIERGYPDMAKLTPRELEVLEYLSRGQPHAEIAYAMQLAPETIRTHSAHIRRKLGVRTSRELIGMPTRPTRASGGLGGR